MTDKDKPIATDAECEFRRSQLIAAGVIKPCDGKTLINKKNSIAVSTKKSSRIQRNTLIAKGFITPMEFRSDPPEPVIKVVEPKEEGEYHIKPITDVNYQRRKEMYLWVIQDILLARKKLNIMPVKKSDSDPDWYF